MPNRITRQSLLPSLAVLFVCGVVTGEDQARAVGSGKPLDFGEDSSRHQLLRLLSSRQPDYRECIWDQAAGAIVVEEAGGRITDLRGRPLDFGQGRTLAANRGVCASNGRLHDAALEALAAIGAVPED